MLSKERLEELIEDPSFVRSLVGDLDSTQYRIDLYEDKLSKWGLIVRFLGDGEAWFYRTYDPSNRQDSIIVMFTYHFQSFPD